MGGAKGVPIAGIRVKIALVDFAVVGAEIDRLIVRVRFKEAMRPEDSVVKRRIKRPLLVVHASLNLRAAKVIIPNGFGAMADGIKVCASNFSFEIQFRLLRADEGRS